LNAATPAVKFDIVLATELLGGLDGGGVVITVEKYRLYEVTIATDQIHPVVRHPLSPDWTLLRALEDVCP
jgi:hypothetical protein